MGKLRHIAFSVPDPWKAAEFYMKAFGLRKVGETDNPLALGVFLTDGVINIALLKFRSEEAAGERGLDFVGLHHLGFWVDDAQEACEAAEAAGARYMMGEVPDAGENSFYEVKYRDPNGIIFDISAHGWGGAVKNVTESETSPAVAQPAAAR
jgi:catechol 2,3-dioxygenase-like lactoylglutathione lyase family enzyme